MAKSGKKSSLKAALSVQQTRLKSKQKAAHAAQVEAHKRREPDHERRKSKAKAKAPAKDTIPFSTWNKILLIGEGNFSFARALLVDPPHELIHLPAKNVTATTYDTEEECCSKYSDAEGIVKFLKNEGVEVLFGVDATKLGKTGALKGRRWDHVVWNFPHAGEGLIFSNALRCISLKMLKC